MRTAGALGFNYSHEALADAMLTNPAATVAELAAMFGRTPGWVSTVRNTDTFREILYRRRGETVDPVVTANLEERFNILTQRSMEILIQKLEKDPKDVPDDLALRAAALGAKGMGFGGFSTKPAAPPPAPDIGRIERLAERLTSLNRPGRGNDQGVIDVVPIASEARPERVSPDAREPSPAAASDGNTERG